MLDGLAIVEVLVLEDISVLPALGLAVANTSFSSASSSIASSADDDPAVVVEVPSLRFKVKRDPSFFIMLPVLLLGLLLGIVPLLLLLDDEERRCCCPPCCSSIPSSDRLERLLAVELFELSLREECAGDLAGRLDRRDEASILPGAVFRVRDCCSKSAVSQAVYCKVWWRQLRRRPGSLSIICARDMLSAVTSPGLYYGVSCLRFSIQAAYSLLPLTRVCNPDDCR